MSGERDNSNNKFLEINKIDIESYISCNNNIYSQYSVLDLVYLPYWNLLSKEDRIQCIVWIFKNLKEQLKLDKLLNNILFIPKVGYENAFASYHKEDKAIFINPNYIESTSLLSIWNLFHEFQHVIQHRDENLIREGKLLKNDFYSSFAYYFMYDGTGYRFGSEEDYLYKIRGSEEFCLELYLRNPIEMDANNYAYLNLKKIIENNFIKYGDDDETIEDLNKIRNMLLPDFKIITDDIAVEVLKYCHTLIELSYEFSKGNLEEHDYNKKNLELYNAIDTLINKETTRILSFNPNNILCKNDYFN